MTKKDYVAIAGALYDAQFGPNPWRAAVHNIAEILNADNQAFDRVRFFDACGYYTHADRPTADTLILRGEK